MDLPSRWQLSTSARLLFQFKISQGARSPFHSHRGSQQLRASIPAVVTADWDTLGPPSDQAVSERHL